MKTFGNKKIWFITVTLFVLIICLGLVFFNSTNETTQNVSLSNTQAQLEDNALYSQNENGLTYGVFTSGNLEELPDLVATMGKHGTLGYMRKDDYLGLNTSQYEIYTLALSKEELEQAREQYKNHYSDVSTVEFYQRCYDIPLFDETGENEIDSFQMSMGFYPYPSTVN